MVKKLQPKKTYDKNRTLIIGSLISAALAVIFYIFNLLPENTHILIKLIPIFIFALFLLSFLFLSLKRNESFQKFVKTYKKRIVIASVIFCCILLLVIVVRMMTHSTTIDKEFIDHYWKYEQTYWEEITTQLKGQFASKINLFPSFYKNAGNQLIFPAIDGLVSICFSKDFRFEDAEYNVWLSNSNDFSGPVTKIVEVNISNQLTISKWAQILSGNGVKVTVDGKAPNDIYVKGVFPEIPPSKIYNPQLGTYSPYTLLTIDVPTDSIENLGISLRDFTIQEVKSGEYIYPFLWRQLDIYGIEAIKGLDINEAKLKASRELSSVLAGLNLGLPKELLSADPVKSVLKNFQIILNDYNNLLLRKNFIDEDLQSYILKYPILISPAYLNIYSGIDIDDNSRIDLIIEETSPIGPSSVLINFGSSSGKLFELDDQIGEELNKSIMLVSSWRKWLMNNSESLSDSFGIKNLDANSPAIIIIGRKNSLTEKNLEDLNLISKNWNYKTRIITYDDILEESINWLNNLNKIEKLYH